MNRLLALDGGGVRGIFTLGVLERIEQIIQERDPNAGLTDYFNFVGGTSTGAIVATAVSWGLSTKEIIELYFGMGPTIFTMNRSISLFRFLYHSKNIEAYLKEMFTESDGSQAELGTDQLKTFLMVVMRNGSRGSVWPLTNNPRAKFNMPGANGISNLNFPLWQLVRASTAAPTFFPSEEIEVPTCDGRTQHFEFIDGGVSSYNNPSMAMFLNATLPAYNMNMPKGVDQMHVVSIGTGREKLTFPPGSFKRTNRLVGALNTLKSLLESNTVEQDKLCRAFGACLYGAPIDLEIADLLPRSDEEFQNKHFTYCRYEHEFTNEDYARLARETKGRCKDFGLDRILCMETLLEIGREYAQATIKPEHIPEGPMGDALERPKQFRQT